MPATTNRCRSQVGQFVPSYRVNCFYIDIKVDNFLLYGSTGGEAFYEPEHRGWGGGWVGVGVGRGSGEREREGGGDIEIERGGMETVTQTDI